MLFILERRDISMLKTIEIYNIYGKTEQEQVKEKSNIVIFPHFKSDGTLDRRYGEKPERKVQDGIVKTQTMECLYSKEEIISVYDVFKKKIDNANSLSKEKTARRNLCMFVSGINLGLRGGDLCSLKWANIFDSDWNYRDKPKFVPEKTKKARSNKVELTWNSDFEIEMSEYLHWINSNEKKQKLTDYIFTSQKQHYDKDLGIKVNHINPKEWWKIMEKTRKEAGILQKIGSHGLRKTMVHSYIMEAEDKYDAKVDMQETLKHRDIRTTGRYCCFDNNKIKEGKQRCAYIHG